MATRRDRQVNVDFTGTTDGLQRAVGTANSALSSVGRTVGALGVGLSKLALVGNALTVISATLVAAQQLAGTAAVLPAALLAGAAAAVTFRIALIGFTDAIDARTPQQWAEATRGMGTNTLAAVRAVRELTPQIRVLQRSVQDRFFAGFAGDVRDLAVTYIPILLTGMTGIADRFAGMRRLIVQTLLMPTTASNLAVILNAANLLLGAVNNSLGDVLAGVLALGAAGAGALPAFGRYLAVAAVAFRTWSQSLDATRVEGLITSGVRGFGLLTAAVVLSGRVIGSVFRALAGPAASDPLLAFRTNMQSALDAVNDPQAQQALSIIGGGLRELGRIFNTLIGPAIRAFLPLLVVLTPAAVALGQAFATVLMPVLNDLVPALTLLVVSVLPIAAPLLVGLANVLANVVVPALVLGVQWVTRLTDSFGNFLDRAGGWGGALSGVGSWLGGLFGRANGGEVQAGRSYLVGENGPEIVSMGRSGTVSPVTAGGAPSITVLVKIGETELRQLVGDEIVTWSSDVATSVWAGG